VAVVALFTITDRTGINLATFSECDSEHPAARSRRPQETQA